MFLLTRVIEQKNATIQYNVFQVETVFKICIQIPNNDIIIKCYQTKRHAPEFYSVANGGELKALFLTPDIANILSF